jgi:heat-inducible transcriptional repressor
MLTDRQQMLLRTLVEAHVELGQPVGSKWLAERSDVRWSSSTVRYELAALEEAGYLNHPHTSAGRVPTDAGYRYYADTILHEGPLPAPAGVQFDVELSNMRREVDAAMRFTTTTLSQMTDLLAAVSAPPLHTATIKHVEVLLLQPQIALVVVITSSGTVTKRAASYLNERLAGTDLGALTLQSKLLMPELSKTERGFLEAIAPVFSDLPDTVEDTLYIDGTSRLLSGTSDVSEMNDLIRMLERRVTLLSVLRSALGESTVYLRIGAENQEPELHSASVVAANYGLGHRTLGAVSVIGPVRMDYRNAILSVRAAAKALSGFVEEVYE